MLTIFEQSRSFTMPLVDDIHRMIVVFLRTSAAGIWEQDDQQRSDALVMHFRRGAWRKGMFSKSFQPTYVNHVEAAATSLCVTVRPTTEEICMRLNYQFHLPSNDAGGWKQDAKVIVEEESRDFADYLTQYYKLPRIPQIAAP